MSDSSKSEDVVHSDSEEMYLEATSSLKKDSDNETEAFQSVERESDKDVETTEDVIGALSTVQVTSAESEKLIKQEPSKAEYDKEEDFKARASLIITYELEKFHKNAMIIFNHENMLGAPKTKLGAELDVEALQRTFVRYGFEVEEKKDGNTADIFRCLEEFASRDFSRYGCVCVTILTHGSKSGHLKSYDGWYSKRQVIACFDKQKNPSLRGKPIIIIIQDFIDKLRCSVVHPGYVNFGEEYAEDYGNYDLPTVGDILIIHSTHFRRDSLRETDKGSWFIQILCETIELLADSVDFVSICTVVIHEIARREEKRLSIAKATSVIQLPVVSSTLVKSIYLCKKNDDEEKKKGDEFEDKEKEYKATEDTGKSVPSYEVENFSKNAMIIFNQENFKTHEISKRIGTEQDVLALITTFELMRFEIVPPETTKDCERKQLLAKLKAFCQKDFTDYGCICLAILTHGSGYGWLMARDVRYNELEVFDCFDVQRNPTLAGKPIFIIIQACRGYRLQFQKKKPNEVLPVNCRLHLPPNLLIFYSSSAGMASAIDKLKGSFFVQSLCKNVKRYAPVTHAEEICRQVRVDVALTDIFLDALKTIMVKQHPVTISTLIKKLYLMRPSQASGAVVEVRSAIESALSMPASSFLKYYNYVMKYLRLYIEENKEDSLVASELLKTAEECSCGPQDKQLAIIKLICRHLEENADKFQQYDFMYFHYPKEDS